MVLMAPGLTAPDPGRRSAASKIEKHLSNPLARECDQRAIGPKRSVRAKTNVKRASRREDDMFRKVSVAKTTHELSLEQLRSVSGGGKMDGSYR